MKGKFMIIAALLGALTFGACVDSEESSSVKAIREAKAEQLKSVAALNNAKAQAEITLANAQAALLQAEAQKAAAQAAYEQARVAWQEAQTESQKITNELKAAQAEAEIARCEAEVARIKAQLEKDLITWQQELLVKKLQFNQAMQGLAAQEKQNLLNIYASYNAALNAVAAMSLEKVELEADIAELNADIAEHEATIESLTAEDAQAAWDAAVEAAEKAVSDNQKKVDSAKANAEAKAAAVEELRALGAVSYPELTKEVENALKALNAASDTKLLATKKYETAVAAMSDYADYTTEDYYLDLTWFKNNSVLTIDDVDTDYDEETANDDHTVFYPVEMDSFGQYGNPVIGDPEKAVSLFDLYDYTWVKDADDNPLYQVAALFYGTHADAVATYEAEVAKLLSTSDEARAKDVAEKALAAYLSGTNVSAVKTASDAYNAQVKAISAKVAAANAEISRLTYLKQVLSDAKIAAGGVTTYDTQIAAYATQIAAQQAIISGAATESSNAYAAYTAAITGLTGNTATLETLQNAVEEKTEDYEDLAAHYAETIDVLKALAAESEAWVAKYVTDYNEAVAAMYNAGVAKTEAEKAYTKANTKYTTLYTDWSDATKWGDISYDAPRLSVMLEDAKAAAKKAADDYAAAQAKLKTAQDNWAAISAMTEEEIAAALEMTLENMIKYYEDEIEACEAEIEALEAAIVLLEQNIKVEEINVENWSAILEDALAE